MASIADLQTAIDRVIAQNTAEADASTAIIAVLQANTQMLRDLIAQGSAGVPDEFITRLNELADTQDANRVRLADAILANTQT